jgi:hypothetical protein
MNAAMTEPDAAHEVSAPRSAVGPDENEIAIGVVHVLRSWMADEADSDPAGQIAGPRYLR